MVLAAALSKKGWNAAFAVTTTSAADLVKARGFAANTMTSSAGLENLTLLWPHGVDLLVIDHYGLDASFENTCRGWAKCLAVIDDLADRQHDSDILVDAAPGRTADAYQTRVPDQCLLLMGPAYALLDNAFRLSRPITERQIRDLRQVVISFGATDPDNRSLIALQAVNATELDAHIVLGNGAPHLVEIKKRIAGKLGQSLRLGLTPSEMADVYTHADAALGAGGVSALERCCVGLPSALAVAFMNQQHVVDGLVREGAALSLDLDCQRMTHTIEALRDKKVRADLSRNALRVVDGLGAARVAQAIDPFVLSDHAHVRLRPLTMPDAEIVLRWQTNPATRRHFRNPNPPTRDEHLGWMKAKITDPACVSNMVLCNERPAGLIRLDRRPDGAYEVSILTAPELNGRGIGSAALAAAAEMTTEAELIAEVLPENERSNRLFARAGFHREGNTFRLSPRAAA